MPPIPSVSAIVCFKPNSLGISKSNIDYFNNEILKQRLSCIPLHINDSKFPYETFEIEINKKNTSGNIEYITTEDFKVKNILTSLIRRLFIVFIDKFSFIRLIWFSRLKYKFFSDEKFNLLGSILVVICQFIKLKLLIF